MKNYTASVPILTEYFTEEEAASTIILRLPEYCNGLSDHEIEEY